LTGSIGRDPSVKAVPKLFPKHVELRSYPYARMAMIAFVAAGTAASPRLRHKRELLRTIEISQNVPMHGAMMFLALWLLVQFSLSFLCPLSRAVTRLPVYRFAP